MKVIKIKFPILTFISLITSRPIFLSEPCLIKVLSIFSLKLKYELVDLNHQGRESLVKSGAMIKFGLLMIFIELSSCKDLGSYSTYFTCYYNKYNNILNSSLDSEERDSFVEAAVAESVRAG